MKSSKLLAVFLSVGIGLLLFPVFAQGIGPEDYTEPNCSYEDPNPAEFTVVCETEIGFLVADCLNRYSLQIVGEEGPWQEVSMDDELKILDSLSNDPVYNDYYSHGNTFLKIVQCKPADTFSYNGPAVNVTVPVVEGEVTETNDTTLLLAAAGLILLLLILLVWRHRKTD